MPFVPLDQEEEQPRGRFIPLDAPRPPAPGVVPPDAAAPGAISDAARATAAALAPPPQAPAPSPEEIAVASRPAFMGRTRGGQPYLVPVEGPTEVPVPVRGEVIKALPGAAKLGLEKSMAETAEMAARSAALQHGETLSGVAPVDPRMQVSPGFSYPMRAGNVGRVRRAAEEAARREAAATIASEAVAEEAKAQTPANMNTLEQALFSGAQSAPPLLAGVATGMAGMPGVGALIAGVGGGHMQGASTYSEATEKYRAERERARKVFGDKAPLRTDAQIHKLAARDAGVAELLEGGGEAAPFGVFFKKFQQLGRAGKLGAGAVAEGGQEGVTQLAQDYAAYLSYHPDLTPEEAWDNFKVATLAGGIMGGGVGAMTMSRSEKDQRGRIVGEMLDKLVSGTTFEAPEVTARRPTTIAQGARNAIEARRQQENDLGERARVDAQLPQQGLNRNVYPAVQRGGTEAGGGNRVQRGAADTEEPVAFAQGGEEGPAFFGVAPVRRDVNGRIIGGMGAENMQTVNGAIRRMVNLSRQGEQSKDWYRDSAHAILNAAGGDAEAARRIAQVLAITSTGTEIKANFTIGMNALDQYARGEPIKVGKGQTNQALNDLLYHGIEPESVKVSDFYRNIVQHLPGGKAHERPVTDRWQFRIASGSGEKSAGGEQQYRYASMLAKEAADKLGMRPDQAQASMWVAMKARANYDKLRELRNESADSKYKGMSNAQLHAIAREMAATSYASEIERRQWKPPAGAKFPTLEELRAASAARDAAANDFALGENVPSFGMGRAREGGAEGFKETTGKYPWEMAYPEFFKHTISRLKAAMPGRDPQWYDGVLRREWAKMRDMGGAFGQGASVMEFGESLGIERKDMPQIRRGDLAEFEKFAAAKGSPLRAERVPSTELRPTQKHVNPELVSLLTRESAAKPLMVSEDGYILDGTNRWVWARQNEPDMLLNVLRVPLPVRPALALLRSFPKAEYQDVSHVGRAAPHEADIVNPISRKGEATADEQIAQISALTEKTRPMLAQLISDLKARFNPPVINDNVKKLATVKAKSLRPEVLRKKPWFGIEHIRDSLRFRIGPASLEDLPGIVQTIREHGWEILKDDIGKLFDTKEFGWRAAVLDLRAPTGQMVELYISPPELLHVNDTQAHILFEKWRDKDVMQLSDVELVEMFTDEARSQHLYNRAWAAYKNRVGQVDEDILNAVASAKLFTGLNLSKSESSSRTVTVGASLPESQRPPTLTARTPGPTSTTREPSRSFQATGSTGAIIPQGVRDALRAAGRTDAAAESDTGETEAAGRSGGESAAFGQGRGRADQKTGLSPENPFASADEAVAHDRANPPSKKRLGRCHELAWQKVFAPDGGFPSIDATGWNHVIGVTQAAPSSLLAGGAVLKARIWHSVVFDPASGNVWEPIADRWYTPGVMTSAFGFEPVQSLTSGETFKAAERSGFYTDQTVTKPRGWEKTFLNKGDYDPDPKIFEKAEPQALGQGGPPAGFAGTSFTQTTKPEAARKFSVMDKTADERNWSPQMKRHVYPANMRQKAVLNAALTDLVKAGFPESLLDEAAGIYAYQHQWNSYYALIWPSINLIAVNDDTLRRAEHDEDVARSLRRYLAHEFAHLLDAVPDVPGLNPFLSTLSPRLEFTMDKRGTLEYEESADLLDEIVVAGTRHQRVTNHFSYPLDAIADGNMAVSSGPAELFAQAQALFFADPGLVKRALPKWYAVLESIYGNEEIPAPRDANEARERLQVALQDQGSQLGLPSGQRVSDGETGGRGRVQEGAPRGPPGAGVGERASFGAGSGRGGNAVPPANAGRVNPYWDIDEPGLRDNLTREWQNNKIDLKRVHEAIERFGGVIRQPGDAYLAEELYHGRVSARIKKFERNLVDPLLKQIKESGHSIDDVGRYLWARHAAERNAQMAKINPGGPTNLSGLYDDAAAAAADGSPGAPNAADIIAGFRRGQNFSELQAIAGTIDQLTAATRALLVREGLEEQGTIDAWQNAYKKYVPLFRDADDTTMTTGAGYHIRGPESKRAMGSQREAQAIVAAVIAQHEKAIIRAEKAKVGRALIKLAEEFPKADFWKVDQPPMKRSINPTTGLVQVGVDPLYRNRPNVYIVKEKGTNGKVTERLITFNENNERAAKLAASMKNLDAVQLSGVTKVVGRVTRLLANLATSYNPGFWATNFARDVQTAAVNLQSTPLRGRAPQVLARIPKTLAGIMSAEFRNGTGRYAALYREFEDAGGKTGWMSLFDSLIDRNNELASQIKTSQRSAADPRVWLNYSLDVIDKVNGTIENATRLAAYVEAREQGMTPEKAASLAKNLTVNFNRKGNRSTATNAWYMFFNASAQGTARLIQSIAKSPRARVMVGLMVGFGAALEIMNRMLGDKDRDEQGNNPWELVPEYVKQKNLIVMLPGGKQLKLPLPYGFNVFFNAGRMAAEAIMSNGMGMGEEKKKPLEMAWNFAQTLIDSFLPLGQASSVSQLIAPTILDPLVQYAENKTWYGAPLRPEKNEFGPPQPNYKLFFRTTSDTAKDLSRWLSDASGGDEVQGGAIDISPTTITHIFSTLTGGTGRFGLGLFDFARHIIGRVTGEREAEDLPASKIPFVGSFYGEVTERERLQKYYRLRPEAMELQKQIRAYKKQGDPDKAAMLEEKKPGLAAMAREIADKQFKADQKSLREEFKAVDDLPRGEREKARRELSKDEDLLISRAVERYNEAQRAR